MKKERLHKYIANCGYCSRRHAELLIDAGLVYVNERQVLAQGISVMPGKDVVIINGDQITLPPKLTIMLHKPAKFITSTNDSHERLTVMDLLPKQFGQMGVVPVGRLDFETEGLLLLTNDGDLNHQLAHPSFECEKEYFVLARGHLNKNQLQRLTNGSIRVEGSVVKEAKIESLKKNGNNTEFHMIIHEGKKRQIRRMVEAVGSEVLYLKRIRMGGLLLGELEKGKFMELSADDISLLKKI